MTTLLIVAGVLGVMYVAVRLLVPVIPAVSAFELKQLKKEDDPEASLVHSRLTAAGLLSALRTALSLSLLLIVAVLAAAVTNGVIAAIATLVLALIVERVTGLPLVHGWGRALYGKLESCLLRVVSIRRYLAFLPVEKASPRDAVVSSEAELLHMVDGATFLETDRRDLIRSALEFTGLSVSDAMSGRRSMKAVDKGEVLGPLLLDELYKTGKAAFVVTDGGLDQIVGILKLEKLTSLDLRDTPTALKAMSPDVHYIDEDAPITEALAYLRSARAPFLVVRSGDTTAGLLTMDNVLRCLFAD